jgi:hypothetical protein
MKLVHKVTKIFMFKVLEKCIRIQIPKRSIWTLKNESQNLVSGNILLFDKYEV